MKKIFKSRKFYFLTTFGLFIISLTIVLVSTFTGNNSESFQSKLGYYQSNQYEITSVSSPTDTNVVPMSSLYTNTVVNNVSTIAPVSGYDALENDSSDIADYSTITISTAEDLYAFSQLTNNTSYQDDFLKYKYKLLSNIDYSECPYYFTPVAWRSNKYFTGIFDGNGYEISNLSFIRITTPDSGVSPYYDMQYFAMFSKIGSTGKVSNFGLIDTVIQNTIDANSISLSGVAPAIGYNAGEVSYIFVKDLRDSENSGIYAAGSFQISGLACNNAGSLHDCYVTYTRVVNYEVTDCIDFNELLLLSTGTVEDLFFYNSSIAAYDANGTENVTYIDAIGKNYPNRVKFGTYAGSISTGDNNLNALVMASSNEWYNSSSYTGISSQIELETPITRGISYNNTDNEFTITNEADYSYMYELMNANSVFASSTYTYKITANINLGLLNPNNYYYDANIAATITGASGTYNTTTLQAGTYSSYPTIFNPSFDNCVTSEGIDCYGLFPYVSGTISNLNVVLTDNYSYNITSNSNLKALGVVTAYLDGGVIDNVNVKYATLSFTNSSINKYYFGTFAGIECNNSEIKNVTATGTYSEALATSNASITGFDTGNSIGGIVGYIDQTMANVNNALSCVNITIGSTLSSGTLDVAVGGIIGSGYTRNSSSGVQTSNLENRGSITVSSTSTITNLYVAGIIGEHLGMANQVINFNNAGNITLNKTGSTLTYLSGVENVNLNSNSQLKSSGKRQYYASSFTNGANISVSSSATVSTLQYANVVNIKENSYISQISGFYNLGYNSHTGNSLGNQTINMSNIENFSAVINYITSATAATTSCDYYLSCETVYNLRNIDLTLSGAVASAKTYNYTGCVSGRFISYSDVRNEGNFDFSLNYAMGSSTSARSTIYVSGVFEELSNGCSAESIYNGGNINFDDESTAAKYLSIYASGICKNSLAVISDNSYNPLNSNFDSSSLGSLNDVINNGDIKLTGIMETTDSTKTSLTSGYGSLTSSGSLYANLYFAGIAITNSGIISNAFNLGDILASVYSKVASTYVIAGIAAYNNGAYAQIRDSANNGDLYCIDMSQQDSQLDIAGIVGSNIATSTNITEVIAFTINYGTINGFTAGATVTSISDTDDMHVRAAGIMAQGLCNIVNVVNYGNVYGSECAAGLVSIVDLSKFTDTTVNIANTINYANILNIKRTYANEFLAANEVTYNDVINATQTFAGNPTDGPYVGALITLIDFNNQSNISIRYLMNFYRNSAVVSKNMNVSVNPDVSTFITTRGSTDIFGTSTNYIKYAPLSTVEDDLGNIGVFSTQFVFRKAIDGANLDSNYVTDSYISDFFQFIRFDKINDNLLDSIGWRTIAYADAAENFARNLDALCTLVTNTSTATTILSEAFTSDTWIESCDVTLLSEFISESIDSGELNASLTDILNYTLFDESSKSTFTTTMRQEIIGSILSNFAENQNYNELLNDLLYNELIASIISQDSTQYQTIYNKLDEILESSDNLDDIVSDYLDLLQAEVDNSVPNSESILSPIFDSSTESKYVNVKISLLETLLEGYTEAELQTLFETLNVNDESTTYKYINYLTENDTECKTIYANLLANNSLGTTAYREFINENIKKYDLSLDIAYSDLSTLEDTYPSWSTTNINNNGQSLTPTIFTGNTTTPLTPTKNYTEMWNMVKNNSSVQEYINDYIIGSNSYTDPTTNITYSSLLAKATENNNTYQSNDRPQSYYGISDNAYSSGQAIQYGVGIVTNTTVLSDYTFTGNGVQDGSSATIPMNMKFVYTPDDAVSNGTYFFGPLDATGKPYSAPDKDDLSVSYFTGKNYNLGANLYDKPTYTVSNTDRDIFPVFLSPDSTVLSNVLNAYNVTNKTQYNYYFNVRKKTGAAFANNYMWKSETFLNSNPTDCAGFLLKDCNAATNDYVKYYFNYTPNQYMTADELVAYDSNVDETKLSGVGYNNQYEATATNQNLYRDYYFKSYVSAAVITGVWYVMSTYRTGSEGSYIYCNSLITKMKDGNGAGLDKDIFGVHTTDYTYYQMSDLVALDGIRTKGYCSETTINNSTNTYYQMADSDEINILSTIITKMLETTNGKKVLLNALAEYNSTTDFTANDDDSLTFLLSALEEVDFASDFIIDNYSSVKDFVYNNTYSIDEYLATLTTTITDYKDRLSAVTVDNLQAFRKLLLLLRNDLSANASSRSEINDLIYEYLAYIYSYDSSISNSEIATLLAAISDTDLTNLALCGVRSFVSYNYDDFVFTNVALINDEGGSSYIRAGSNSTMTYTLPDTTYDYKLSIVYSGTIAGTASDGSNTVSINVPKTSSTATFQITADTEIYSINATSIADPTTVSLGTMTTVSACYNSSNAGPAYTAFTLNADNTITYSLTGNNTGNNNNTNAKTGAPMVTGTMPISFSSISNGTADIVITYKWGATNRAITTFTVGNVSQTIGSVNGATVTVTLDDVAITSGEFNLVVNTIYNQDNSNSTTHTIEKIEITVTQSYGFSTSSTTEYSLLDGTIESSSIVSTGNDINLISNYLGTDYTYPLSSTAISMPNYSSLNLVRHSESHLSDYLLTHPFDATYFLANYDNLSDFAKFIMSDVAKTIPVSATSIEVTENAYIVVKARNTTTNVTGTITINNETLSFSNASSSQLVSVEKGKYTIINSGATIEEIVVHYVDKSISVETGTSDIFTLVENNTETTIYEGDYSAIASFTLPSEYSTFKEFYSSYNDLLTIVETLWGTITNVSGDKTIFTDLESNSTALFTDSILKEIITLIAIADYDNADDTTTTTIDEDSTLSKLIEAVDADYSELLKGFDSSVVMETIAKKIYEIVSSNTNTYDSCAEYIYAFYLGNDYVSSSESNSLLNSELYSMLEDYSDGSYQFIQSDGTVDADIFNDLLEILSGGSTTINIDSYGIFALSSSKGINDGIFIPDNFTLSNMDVFYKVTDSIWKLYSSDNDAVASAEWRGGTTSDFDSITDTDSVNYAFLSSMKQLKKSISTAIFNLDLEYTDGSDNTTTIYSAESLIDLDNNTITYYVPTGLFSGTQSFTISRLILANAATSSLGVNGTMSLSIGTNADKIVITAEDTTVVSYYTIILVEMDISFDISSMTTSIPYTAGKVDISLTSPRSGSSDEALPNNFDLTPFIYLVNSSNEVVDSYSSTNTTPFTYMTLSTDTGNHIVYNGSSSISIDISSSLPTGTYKIYLSIFGTYGLGTSGEYISFTKLPSTQSEMSDVSFDGSSISFTTSGSNYVATSTIPYGRAYSDTELEDMSYLDYLPTISNGATVSVTATKQVTNLANAPMTYTITYTVTAEDESSTTYIHYLVENTPYVENSAGTDYVTWYKDGTSQGTITFDPEDTNTIATSFERGNEPLYRVKFGMNYFYTNGNAVYTTESSASTGVSTSILYAGISAQVTELADAGTYTFTYIFTTTGTWDGASYTRVYTFPSLVITKNASKDASLSRITFADSYEIASGLSTIIRPNYSMRPSDDSLDTNTNEIDYSDMFETDYTRDILISGKTVKYDNLSASQDYATTDSSNQYFTNDFFVLGSIANAELSYYAPTFALEEHAEIYQYTTLEKLTSYGLGQTENEKTDYSILTNHDTIYLYVPFTSSSGTRVFLVQVENGKWTNVYSTVFDGTNQDDTYLGTMNGTRTATITSNSVTYTVDDSAGTATDNTSLYMDYIGSPDTDHFWYVSYIIFSEDYLTDSTAGSNGFNNEYFKCYHISLIDITNTIYFNVLVKAPTTFDMESLFLTVATNLYTTVGTTEVYSSSNQISAYATLDAVTQISGYNSYSLNSNLSVLPNGYFYFYLDLPDGYTVKYTITNGKANGNADTTAADYNADEAGSYLPPSSIVTQRVDILIEITADTTSDGTIWGASTSVVYTRQIIFNGVNSTTIE